MPAGRFGLDVVADGLGAPLSVRLEGDGHITQVDAAGWPVAGVYNRLLLTISGDCGAERIEFHTTGAAFGTGMLQGGAYGFLMGLGWMSTLMDLRFGADRGDGIVHWIDAPLSMQPLTDTPDVVGWSRVAVDVATGAGDDRLYVLNPPVPSRIDAGAGNDRIVAENGGGVLFGNDGVDTVFMMAGQALLLGGAGDDILSSGAADDTLRGGSGDDYLQSTGGVDQMFGGSGDDTLLDGAGDDLLMGNAGNDLLIADSGNNLLLGGRGNDTLQSGGGADILMGGDGADTFRIRLDTASDNMVTDHGVTVLDFDAVQDHLVFVQSDGRVDAKSWDELSRHTFQDGSDVILRHPDGVTVVFRNLVVADLLLAHQAQNTPATDDLM